MHYENLKSFAIAMVTVLGFLLAPVPVANAQNTFQCTGTISNTTINSSLVVPTNALCILNNVTVVGNVQVGKGATLEIFPGAQQTVTIDGNIVADQCRSVFFGTNVGVGVVSVAGNVNIHNCTSVDPSGYQGPNVTISGNFVCAYNAGGCLFSRGVIQGNLTADNNTSEIPGSGGAALFLNQVSGNVDVSGNTGSVNFVSGNTIGGNLRCFNNNPAPVDQGEPNTASGHKEGQCANL